MHQTTPDADPSNPPAPQRDDGDLRARLDAARRDLLDLTTRNRLLATPRHRKRSSSIEIVDELTEQVFRILVAEGKDMSFLPAPDEDEPETQAATHADDEPADVLFDVHLVQPEEEPPAPGDEPALAARHLDRKLQTELASAVLQQRLLRLHYDARTIQEEQGVNVLFLALGFLEWYEAEAAQSPRHAPLILVPVELDRRSASSRFRVRWTGEDITTNLSLQVKLRTDFGVELPDVPDGEDLDPAAYLDAVRASIEGLPRWAVRGDDIVLWSFSFAKLMMFRDLDPETWPEGRGLTGSPLLRSLLSDGFTPEPPLWNDDADLDQRLPALETIHIVDADSSQSTVIEAVRRGRSLVVQGPPGTGKSQTIANVIAAAVCSGKRVLFLAEKMAALDVVKRRLINAGLGDRDRDQCDLCLELHSTRATKRKVLAELARTLDLQRPRLDDVATQAAELEATRARLDDHAAMMHAPDEPSGLTPFRVVGELVRLRAAGVEPADFTLPEAEGWTPDDLRLRVGLVDELTASAGAIGVPAEHPWRGVMLDALLPTDRQRLGADLPGPLTEVGRTLARSRELAELLDTEPPDTPRDVERRIAFAQRMAAMPPLDAEAIDHPCWPSRHATIERLVTTGAALRDTRRRLDGVVAEAAWTADVAATRRDLAAWGNSLFRFLHGDYRRAVASLRGLLAGVPPRGLDARLAILDTLIEGQAAVRAVRDGDELGRQAFGTRWSGVATDWDAAAAIVEWDRACRDDPDVPDGFRSRARHLAGEGQREAGRRAEALQRQLDSMRSSLGDLFARVRLDVRVAFGPMDGDEAGLIDAVALGTVEQRLAAWITHLESISSWITFRARDEAARTAGLADLADRIFDGRIAPDGAADALAMAYAEAIARRLMRARPAFARFDGLSHERILEAFRALDRQRIDLARQQVALAHFEAIPRGGGEIGELGLIRHEIHKRRRHLPIRRLLAEAGTAVTRIKPVFMMSPLSVAQYLAPGALEFDLLLIDEASQVRPVEALGAAARARQIVVVGDEKQLPPTRFFARTLSDTEEADTDDAILMRAEDQESILGLAASRNLDARMLRWHYRSRHHSLIAVSNREFYDGRLFVIPSPYPRGALGVVLHHLPEARYDRGGTRVNRVEARLVAEAVMSHADRCGDLSLGVGTFSVPQRDAILDELERLRREHEGLEPFFAGGSAEPFFVKNLENVQGDERDVIFISVGYGPDAETGQVSMNFGPLSAAGGERRLNVLITRARRRCEVFTSIRHEDIDLGRATGRGPEAFKAYLRFAESGDLSMATPTGRGPDSPFEAAVARAIESTGYAVEPQVGVAGFFVDLAVRDPEHAGRFVLGIECDGASYHASRWARDRDRLRQQVLEGLGWTIHRIWSVDWFQRPQEQLARVVEAIERARAAAPAPAPPPARDQGPLARVEVGDDGDDGEATFTRHYVEASLRVPRTVEIHEMPTTQMAGIVERIVEVETPIHGDEIAQRVTALWGFQRTGSRIRRCVMAAIEQAVRGGRIRHDEGFYLAIDGRDVEVRDRSSVSSSTLRRPDMIPPQEIRACVRLLVERHVGASRDEAIVTTARRLGFRMTSAQLRAVIDAQIDAMLTGGALIDRDGRLKLAQG